MLCEVQRNLPASYSENLRAGFKIRLCDSYCVIVTANTFTDVVGVGDKCNILGLSCNSKFVYSIFIHSP